MKSSPRFVADAMLGSLARKLRIFGFDTLYFDEGNDSELQGLAKREKRVILTSDKGLAGRSSQTVRVVLVEGRTDRARLLSIRSQVGAHMAYRVGGLAASRCAVCNGELESLEKGEAARLAPRKVSARHRLFFRCTSCSRLYWRGGHWERLRRLSYSLRTKDLT